MVKLSKWKPIDYSKLLIDETIEEEGKRGAVKSAIFMTEVENAAE